MYQFQAFYMNGWATTIVLVVLARLVYCWLLPKPLSGIPHNRVMGIQGDLPELTAFMSDGRKGFADYIAHLVEKHGPLFQILVGRSPILVVTDRAEVERILLKEKCTDQSKRTRQIFASFLPSSMIALPAGQTWKRHRRLMSLSMSRRYLQRMSSHISTRATELVRLWTRKIDLAGGSVFGAEIDLQLATLDTIIKITAGASPDCLKDAYTPASTSLEPVSPSFHTAVHKMMQNIEYTGRAAFPALTGRMIAWFSPSWRRSYSMFEAFFNRKVIEARLKETTRQESLTADTDCVLDMVIQKEIREGEKPLEKHELMDELIAYIIAGQDSTSSALAWLVKFLPLDMAIQRKLHDEVCGVFGAADELDHPLSFEELDSAERMPILEAVVSETLRCAGVASLSARELTEDHVILGRHVPKGTSLMFPIALMNIQTSDWGPDAPIWRPARWLRPDGSFDRTAGPSMPFSLGSRACFGQRLAVLQIKVFLATMIRCFVLKKVPAELDSWEASQVVTRQPDMCFVSLEKWTE